MKSTIKENGSFVRAVIRDKETAYLVCSNDKSSEGRIAHAVLMQWDDGDFGHIDTFNQYAAGLEVITAGALQMIAVSEYGEVVIFGSGEHYKERINTSIKGLKIRGPLRCVKRIEEKIFVAGANLQIFVRQGQGRWLNITPIEGQYDQSNKNIIAFESIDGFSSDDIYAVGWGGTVYWLSGGEWSNMTLPTNLILTGVCCAPDGFVYICGQLGTLFRGRGNKWEVINTDFKYDFWNMTWFNGSLYLATFQDLYKLVGNEIHTINLTSFNNVTFFDLTSEGDLMWSIGAKDILAFNGADWWRVA